MTLAIAGQGTLPTSCEAGMQFKKALRIAQTLEKIRLLRTRISSNRQEALRQHKALADSHELRHSLHGHVGTRDGGSSRRSLVEWCIIGLSSIQFSVLHAFLDPNPEAP